MWYEVEISSAEDKSKSEDMDSASKYAWCVCRGGMGHERHCLSGCIGAASCGCGKPYTGCVLLLRTTHRLPTAVCLYHRGHHKRCLE